MILNLKKNFIKTFGKEKIKSIEDYYSVLDLYQKGFTRKEISKKLKISIYKVYDWISRRTQPISVKIFEIFKKRDYFDINSKDDLECLSYLVGYNLGDGHISRDLCKAWFYGVDSDLEDIKKILIKFKVTPKIYVYKIDNGKMVVGDRVFSRFLHSLGAVKGDKTKLEYNVPKWIIESEEGSFIKKKFLQGLCDSELSKISEIKDRRFSFQSLKFYMVKEENYVQKGTFYLNQLRDLFSEFNITTTKVREDRTYIRSRDNSKMVQLYFVVHSNYQNLYNFLTNIGFLYNSKRILSEDIISKIKSLAEKEMDKISHYYKVKVLRKKGLSYRKIANELDIPTHLVKYWVCGKGGKPRYLTFKTNNS